MSGEPRKYPEWLVEAAARARFDLWRQRKGIQDGWHELTVTERGLWLEDAAHMLTAAFDARPPCPTCGGTRRTEDGRNANAICPDCFDGTDRSGVRVAIVEPAGSEKVFDHDSGMFTHRQPLFRLVRPYQDGE